MPDPLSLALGSILTLTIYKISKVSYRIAPYLRRYSVTNHSTNIHQTVIVAGATDGIGLQFVRWLAAHNYRVVAIGRNPTKLAELHKISDKIATHQIDFSYHYQQNEALPAMMDSIRSSLPPLKDNQEVLVKGIINCVSISHFSRYQNLSNTQINKFHQVNISTLHTLLHLNEKIRMEKICHDKPFFINISSVVAHSPHKYSSVYSATKAYMSNLIEAIAKQQPAVTYLDVQPWYVKTKMVGYQDTWDTVDPKQIVEGSMKLLGRRSSCSGCLKHELIQQFSWILKKQTENRLEQVMARVDKITKLRNRTK